MADNNLNQAIHDKKVDPNTLTAEQKEGYVQWLKRKYGEQYESWMPWIEDLYLKWFTRDNKASYATRGMSDLLYISLPRHQESHRFKCCTLSLCASCLIVTTPFPNLMLTAGPTDTLDKTKVTGVEQVDTLQDGVNNLVSSQVGQGGLLQPVGDAFSKEGVNRAERGGKDDQGNVAPGDPGMGNKVVEGGKGVGGGVMNAGSSAGSGIMNAGKSTGGYLGGMWGGKKEQQ